MNKKMARVYILLGSEKDAAFAARIPAFWKKERIPVDYTARALSAHKLARRVLAFLKQAEARGGPRVYIAVAGLSNALGPLVSGHVLAPVLNCPPPSDAYGGADLFSSLRAPSGVPCATVLSPENAALLAAQVLALSSQPLARALQRYRARRDRALLAADRRLQKKGL